MGTEYTKKGFKILNYSCKYKIKTSSIYGEPNFTIINKLTKMTNLKLMSLILI